MTAVATSDAARAPSDHVRRIVERSGTSFRWSMRILPRERRDAMYAVYAFCREVDDIADEPGETASKERELDAWRREIDAVYAGRATRATGRALTDAVSRFALPREAFLAVIDGMAMDVRGETVAPSEETLRLYCNRVAGAVGRLSLPIFGGAHGIAEELATKLGEALQITNILRDLDDDAAMGRLYLPRERLQAHGIPLGAPPDVLAHANLGLVCGELAALARTRFAESHALIARGEPRRLKPCLLMMAVYTRLLDRLERRGWQRPRTAVGLSRAEKLWIGLRHGIL